VNREIAWFLLPIAGLLSQIGGTWWRPARRVCIPIALSLTLILVEIEAYKAILCGISVWIAAFFPFTLKGDDLKDHWYNWVWIWILGYFMGLGSAWIHPSGFLFALVPAVVVGAFGSLSNVPGTSRFFPWKFCETVFWIAAMYPFIILI